MLVNLKVTGGLKGVIISQIILRNKIFCFNSHVKTFGLAEWTCCPNPQPSLKHLNAANVKPYPKPTTVMEHRAKFWRTEMQGTDPWRRRKTCLSLRIQINSALVLINGAQRAERSTRNISRCTAGGRFRRRLYNILVPTVSLNCLDIGTGPNQKTVHNAYFRISSCC